MLHAVDIIYSLLVHKLPTGLTGPVTNFNDIKLWVHESCQERSSCHVCSLSEACGMTNVRRFGIQSVSPTCWPQKPVCRQMKLPCSCVCIYLRSSLSVWSFAWVQRRLSRDLSIYYHSRDHAPLLRSFSNSICLCLRFAVYLFIASLSASLAFSHLTLNSP